MTPVLIEAIDFGVLSKGKLNLSFDKVTVIGPCDVLDQLEIMSQVTLGRYDTKFFYQWELGQ